MHGDLRELQQLVSSTQQAAEDVAASLQDSASRARQHNAAAANGAHPPRGLNVL